MSIALPGHANALNIELAKVQWGITTEFGVEFLVLDSQEQGRLRGFVTFRGETSQVSKLDYRARFKPYARSSSRCEAAVNLISVR